MVAKGIKLGSFWKPNSTKFSSISDPEISSDLSFLSINSGKSILMKDCLYDDLLPLSLRSSPISSLAAEDSVWIATSMLSRVSEFTENLVVMEKNFPVGIIGPREIFRGILSNPSPGFFDGCHSMEIMNRKFYLDTRKVKISKILAQMQRTKRIFTIIQNEKFDYSGVSIREILEIGSMCKLDSDATSNLGRKIKPFKRDDSVADILKWLTENENEILLLEDESMVIDHQIIIEKIVTDLNFLNGVEGFLDLSASIFQFQTPKLIPEKLHFSEICKVMLEMKNPYVMTSNRIWTPYDVLQVLTNGVILPK